MRESALISTTVLGSIGWKIRLNGNTEMTREIALSFTTVFRSMDGKTG